MGQFRIARPMYHVRNMFLALGLGSALLPVSAEETVLHILTDDYPPYSFRATDGSVDGLATNKVHDLMKAAGVSYTLTIVSWPRAFVRASSEPGILIYSLSRTAEREAAFHWILPLKRAEFHLFGRNEPGLLAKSRAEILASPYRGICELKTQQCNLLARYGFPEDRIMRPVETTTAERIRLILRGRADFIVAEPRVVRWHTDKADIPADAIASYGIVDAGITDYLAASLGTAPELLARLKAAVLEVPMIEALPPDPTIGPNDSRTP